MHHLIPGLIKMRSRLATQFMAFFCDKKYSILTFCDKKYRILTFRDKKYCILRFREKKYHILTFCNKNDLYLTVVEQNNAEASPSLPPISSHFLSLSSTSSERRSHVPPICATLWGILCVEKCFQNLVFVIGSAVCA